MNKKRNQRKIKLNYSIFIHCILCFLWLHMVTFSQIKKEKKKETRIKRKGKEKEEEKVKGERKKRKNKNSKAKKERTK